MCFPIFDMCFPKHPGNNFHSYKECMAACPFTKNTFDFKKFCGKSNNKGYRTMKIHGWMSDHDLTEKTQQYVEKLYKSLKIK